MVGIDDVKLKRLTFLFNSISLLGLVEMALFVILWTPSIKQHWI